MGVSETTISFYNEHGHHHDGVDSTKIDFSRYTPEDLIYLKRALGLISSGSDNTDYLNAKGIYFNNGQSSVVVDLFTPAPTGLVLTTGVANIEYEFVYIDATWTPSDTHQPVDYEVILRRESDGKLDIQRIRSETSPGEGPSTTIGASSNGAVLPQGTIYVVSTADFPSSGQFSVTIDGRPIPITYTGKTSGTFTGCQGGPGVLATGQTVAGVDAPTNTARFMPVDPGTDYSVTVRAFNPLNVPSEVLGPVYITSAVDTSVPAVPVNVTAIGGFSTMSVTWDENTELDVAKGRGFYDVQIALTSATYDAANGFTSALQSARMNGTLAVFTGLDTFATYQMIVRAVDSSGNASNYSDPIFASTSGLGTADPTLQSLPWEQTFEEFDIDSWDIISGTTGDFNVQTGIGGHGGDALRINGTGTKSLAWKYNFAYDPNKTYKIAFRIKSNVGTVNNINLGLLGVGADRIAFVNTLDVDSTDDQYWFAAKAASLDVDSAYATYVGYFRGVDASPTGDAANDPNFPGPVHTNVRYFRPRFKVDVASGTSVDIDSISIEEVGFQVGTFNLAALAVATGNLQDLAVATEKIAAAAVTTSKLTVASLGDNLVANPSFEDTESATEPSRWTPGYSGTTNASYGFETGASDHTEGTQAFSIDIPSSPTTSSGTIASGAFPVKEGDDYYVNVTAKVDNAITDGFFVKVVFDTSETFVGEPSPINIFNDVALTTSFQNKEGTFTGPSGKTWARLVIYHYQPDVVSKLFIDNVNVRKLVVSAVIADGAITTDKLFANAVTAAKIAANTITAAEIAADAITTSELAAEAVTAEKLFVTTGSGNMLMNSDFEAAKPPAANNIVDRWVKAVTETSVTRSSAVSPQHGSFHASITNISGGTQDNGIHSNFISNVFEGATYTFSCYIRAATTGRTMRVIIDWYNSDNVFISSSTTTGGTSDNTWQRLSVTGTAPSNTFKCKVYAYSLAAANGETHYYDAAQLEMAGSVSAWKINTFELAPGTIAADAIVAGTISGDHIAANSITAANAIFTAAAIVSADIRDLVVSKLLAGTIRAETIILGNVSDVASTTVNGTQTIQTGTTTLNVATNGANPFPSSGMISIYNGSTIIAAYSYTGKTASSFTGLTPVEVAVTLTSGWTVKGPGLGPTSSRGIINSASYSPGVDGWYIDQVGNVEFNNAVFRGAIFASKVSGTDIFGSTITGGLIRTATSGQRIEITDASSAYDRISFYTGNGSETNEGNILIFTGGSGANVRGAYNIVTPNFSGQAAAQISMYGEAADGSVGTFVAISAELLNIYDNDGNARFAFDSSGITMYQTNDALGGTWGGSGGALLSRSGTNTFSADWVGSTMDLVIDNGTGGYPQLSVLTATNQISIAGAAAKTFVIEHPTDQDKYLVHAAIEGPSIDVYYRGEATLVDGHARINLPSYFEALTGIANRTVHLTAIRNGSSAGPELEVSRVFEGGFDVYGDSDKSFFWEVKAERKDVARLKVEPRKSDYELMGNGPYTWLRAKSEV